MKTYALTLAIALTASFALGDATLEEKNQIHFAGAIGSVINAFGRSATHEGVVTEIAIHKNRKSSRNGDTGEIVDLDQEKVYYVDYARKTYRVMTFDQLRQQYEESKQRASSRETRSADNDQRKGPEYEVEFSVKSTGNKETINGWPTREEIATVTVHEKGKTLEDAGGFVLTSDMWMGPRVAARRELVEFEQRFMKKVYGDSFMTDMRQAAATLATTPAFAKAMKTYNEKQGSFEGSAIRTKMTFDTVAGKNPSADQQTQPASPASAVGSLFGRMKRHQNSEDSGPQRSTMFDSSNELLKATTSASADDVALPAGFTQK
jgi:hypothetical protein